MCKQPESGGAKAHSSAEPTEPVVEEATAHGEVATQVVDEEYYLNLTPEQLLPGGRFSKRYHGRIGWDTIGSLRTSFLAKALTVLSISIMILGQGGLLGFLIGDDWKFVATLIGAAIFLVGYILPYLVATPEFKSPKTIGDQVDAWVKVNGRTEFNDRQLLFRDLIIRISKERPPDLPEGQLYTSKECLDEMRALPADGEAWRLHQGRLYNYDLILRSYDQFNSRRATAVILVVGIVLISIPAIVRTINVFS